MTQELLREHPNEVVIEVTSRCNYHCEGCFNMASFAQKGRHNELDGDLIVEVIGALSQSNVSMVRFSGGEPLLNKDLFSYLGLAKKQGLKVRVNTNAALINEKNVDEFTDLADSVLVSFNGHDEISDFAWTKKEGAFEAKMRALRLLSDRKIEIRTGTVLTTENIHHLEKIYSVLGHFRVDHWEVYRPIVIDEHEPFKGQINDVVNKLIALSVKFKKVIPIANALPFCLYHDLEVINMLSLGALSDDGHTRFIVDPRGFAKPSYFINENLGDPRNILEAWNSPFMLKMRTGGFLPDECRSCEYKNQCRGGSRFRASKIFGHYGARDPLMVIR